jgi:hypothetical protein
MIQPERIIKLLKEEGYVDPTNSLTNDQYIHKIVEGAGEMLVKSLFGIFVDRAFKGTPLSYLTMFI